MPSGSSERSSCTSTFSNPLSERAFNALSWLEPTTLGTVREVDTWMTTSAPSCWRAPAPGSMSRTRPSVESEGTVVERTVKPLFCNIYVASACVMPVTSGTTFPPHSSI